MLNLILHLGVMAGINIILAASLNIINGYCGLFSLGHAGFFAVGAYVGAMTTKFWFPELTAQLPYMSLLVALLVGTVAAGLVGLAIGIPCLRLSGDYLAIASLGFGEIIRIVIVNMESVGGPRGLPGIARLVNFPIVAIAVVLVLLFLYRVMSSSFGRCVIAIREDEIAARSMGVDVVFYKVFAFVLGSAVAGFAGVLFSHYAQFISPTNFTFLISVQILTMIVIGGLGYQWGAVLGALVVTLIPELLRFSPTLSEFRVLIFGVLMVLMMLVQPKGIMGIWERLRRVP